MVRNPLGYNPEEDDRACTLARLLRPTSDMRIPLMLLLSGSLGITLALIWPRPDPDRALEQAVAEVQAGVTTLDHQLEAVVDEVAEQVAIRGAGSLWQEPPTDMPAGAMVLVWQQGELAYWGRSPVDAGRIDTASNGPLILRDGMHLHHRAGDGVHVLFRVWSRPPIENRFLHSGFAPVLNAPEGLVATRAPGTGPVLRDAAGRPIARLAWASDRQLSLGMPRWPFWTAGGLLVLAGLVLGSVRLSRQQGPWVGVLSLVLSVAALRWWMLMAGPLPGLEGLPLFDPALFAASALLPSLGDLLVNALLLLVLAATAHHLLGRGPVDQERPREAWGWATVLLALGAWTNGVLIGIVNDSSVDLDLYHVQSFDRYSWLALAGMGTLLGAWTLFAHTGVRRHAATITFRRTGVGLLLLITVHLVVLHLAGVRDTVLMVWPLPPVVLLAALDRRPRMAPGLLLLAVLAAYTAHVLDRYAQKREERDRLVLAERTVAFDDPVVELLFRDVVDAIHDDGRWSALWKDETLPCTPTDLDQLRQEHFTGYWERYDVRLTLLGRDLRPRCTTAGEALDWTAFAELTGNGMPERDRPVLRTERQGGGDLLFLGAVLPRNAEVGPIVVELRSRLMPEGLGFPDLLLAGDRPIDRRLERYARARYEAGELSGLTGPYPYPLEWARAMDGPELRFREGAYDHLAYGDPAGTLVVLGLPVPSLLDRLTTFSYLFTCYALLAGLVLGLRELVVHRGFPQLGLGMKLRVGILLFAAIGLVLFAIGARRLAGGQYEARSRELLEERTRSVLVELQQKVGGEPRLATDLGPYLDHLLVKLSNVFFTDLSLFATDGELLATSREQVYTAGLLGRWMDPGAFRRLHLKGASAYVQEERIGAAAFRTSYAPLRNDQGDVLAYLALPYFARQAELEQERAGLIVAIVNLFAVLFVLSVVAAAFIANWTTRPLRLLEQGLERIALGGTNEPIRYQGQDELGHLVEVYNRKVAELRASADRLAASERESAWREMARQVAHEIKNPLTPMKLGLQHFERTWDPDAPDAGPRLQRFTAGMVQQIDALSTIASEFSSFAQMPRAQATDLDLREVVRAAVDVYHGHPQVRFTAELPEPLPVHADREHLLRVFNNLLLNALQAIPEEREGLVEVHGRVQEGRAVVSVTDNGTGISEADRERIFRPNFTTKGSGTGLGLAMVKRLVENAGGSVHYETEEGMGTTFRVELPLRR